VAFVRPVAWLLALLGDRVLRFEAAGVTSGASSRGHRFLAPQLIDVAAPQEYADQLRAAFVEVDIDARRQATLEAGKAIAAQAGLTLYRDEALLNEVTGLVEWPFPVL